MADRTADREKMGLEREFGGWGEWGRSDGTEIEDMEIEG